MTHLHVLIKNEFVNDSFTFSRFITSYVNHRFTQEINKEVQKLI